MSGAPSIAPTTPRTLLSRARPLGAIIRGYEMGVPSHPPPGLKGRPLWKDGVYVGNRSGVTLSAVDEDPDFEG